MQIEFNASDGPSLGVEVELELIDLRTGQLASVATPVLTELGVGHPDGVHPKAKHELFECCIEIVTGVCTTVAEARADLEATLAEVRAAAARHGCTVICSGSHPFSLWGEQRVSPNERYDRLVDEMQWMARRLQIFGVHVHVGVRSGEKAIVVANAVANRIPHLLALTASSPFWEGHDTGLASTRSKVFEGLPTAGLPADLADWADFEQYMSTLVAAGAISTVREVWWDVRPHPDFGTVELRMCDGIPTMGEVASVAALAQALVAHIDRRHDEGAAPARQRDWILCENKWRAARHGLDAELIVDDGGRVQPARDAILQLVADVRPDAERLGCADELDGITAICEHGASYERQRRASEGGTNLWAVVDQLARELSSGEPSR
ncbi:MAG: glutamate--cysteine ligase [Acidimicrobiales bacterium]|nr:glutamate--cysteine ligase [Acidimicrobiales bacterium]HRW38282.1 glutamate--cysteine ligase [Aquihabitans sp.]